MKRNGYTANQVEYYIYRCVGIYIYIYIYNAYTET